MTSTYTVRFWVESWDRLAAVVAERDLETVRRMVLDGESVDEIVECLDRALAIVRALVEGHRD